MDEGSGEKELKADEKVRGGVGEGGVVMRTPLRSDALCTHAAAGKIHRWQRSKTALDEPSSMEW